MFALDHLTQGRDVYEMFGESEWRQIVDTTRHLGLPGMFHLGNLDKGPWQARIRECGYNITSLACFFLSIGDEQLVFSSGQAHWIGGQGYGPSGVFLFAYNKTTGQIRPRELRDSSGHNVLATGVRALAQQYGFTAHLSKWQRKEPERA